MTATGRFFKRLTFLLSVGFFVALFGASYYFVSKPAPTCSDGIANQGEQSIDCGGPCAACPVAHQPEEDLIVREIAFVPGSDTGLYDIIVKIYNPNDELGLPSFRYTIFLQDTAGNILAERTATGFILPQETKYFLEISLSSGSAPAKADIVFSDMEWEKFIGYQEKPRFVVTNRRYEELSGGDPNFSRAISNVTNDSIYNFAKVSVKCILRDEFGKPLAINQTEEGTFLSRQTREPFCLFPKAFPGKVSETNGIEIEVEADIYHKENLIIKDSPSGAPKYR